MCPPRRGCYAPADEKFQCRPPKSLERGRVKGRPEATSADRSRRSMLGRSRALPRGGDEPQASPETFPEALALLRGHRLPALSHATSRTGPGAAMDSEPAEQYPAQRQE